jgi:hypothetical protein
MLRQLKSSDMSCFGKKEDDFLERVRKALNSPLRVKNNLSCFLLKLKNLEESLKG